MERVGRERLRERLGRGEEGLHQERGELPEGGEGLGQVGGKEWVLVGVIQLRQEGEAEAQVGVPVGEVEVEGAQKGAPQ
jgi:hypothetical protein